MAEKQAVLAVMDAQCALCARGARWIARNDPAHQFRIVPVQTPRGHQLMLENGLDPSNPVSWLVIDAAGAHDGLDALMVAGKHMGGIWRGLAVLRMLPKRLRDALYRLVARNRYRVFGHADLCGMPDPDVRARLLE